MFALLIPTLLSFLVLSAHFFRGDHTYLMFACFLAPLLLWSRRTRWLVTVLAVGFHAFIAWAMGLVLFSAQALVFQLVLYDDGAYAAFARRLRRLGRRRAGYS